MRIARLIVGGLLVGVLVSIIGACAKKKYLEEEPVRLLPTGIFLEVPEGLAQ